jgi:hypothetical protein
VTTFHRRIAPSSTRSSRSCFGPPWLRCPRWSPMFLPLRRPASGSGDGRRRARPCCATRSGTQAASPYPRGGSGKKV